MLQGTLRLFCGCSAEDVLQSQIHLAHPVGRGHGLSIQKHDRSGHIFGGPREGGKPPLPMVGCRDPSSLKRRLTLVQVGQYCLSGRSLTDEFALSPRSFTFDVI
jgi:hypothetical protein